MKKKGVWFLLALIIIVAWWWLLQGRADAAPEVGVPGVWSTWGHEADRLQVSVDGVSLPDDSLVRVRTRGNAAPDVVILNNAELVRSPHEQGLVEPLARWDTNRGHGSWPSGG